MIIRIAHATSYVYDAPVRHMVQLLRLAPRPFEGQHVRRWRVETEPDQAMRRTEDAFGNPVDLLFIDRPLTALTLSVTGEVEVGDTDGVLIGLHERVAPDVYLRETPLTAADGALADFAAEVAPQAVGLDFLHALMAAVRAAIVFDTAATGVGASAAEAFALRRGVCQDLTHVFIAAARRRGVPARYVSGHLAREDGVVEQEASHAWVEAHVPDLGWVGFDPTNGVCPADRHVRIAAALDYLGAAPVRGARQGGGGEHLTVRLSVAPVEVEPARRPGQFQRQQQRFD